MDSISKAKKKEKMGDIEGALVILKEALAQIQMIFLLKLKLPTFMRQIIIF